MSVWSKQRQAIIVTYMILIAMIGVAIFYFLVIYNPPSCFDGEQNGYEEGIDCGGGCELVCPFSASNPNIAWARAFEVGPGVYNFAAEVENPNFEVGTTIEYSFRGYNEENILVAEINDEVTLYPTEKRIIFEPAVETGSRTVNRVFLEFGENSGWYQTPRITQRVITQDYRLDNLDIAPSLRVDLRNTDIRSISDLIVTAVLFNQNDNVEQVSRTIVDGIGADSVGQAFFSWRKPFDATIQNVEVFVIEPRE